MIKLSPAQLPALKLASPSMDKVNKLGWSTGFTLRTYGVDIGIRSNDPETLDRVVHHLPANWQSTAPAKVDRMYSILHRNGEQSGSRRPSLLYSDDRRLARSADLDDLFNTLESNLRIFVAEFAKRRVFVHAGAVGWKGRAIIIPGRSYSGKSTLVAELVRAGATYYSDEFAVLDARGRVHPFIKPIELRAEGTNIQSKVDVTELGGRTGKKPLPVGLVLITRYQPGASWRPKKLTAGKSVLELLLNTVSARRDPESAFGALRHVVGHADVLKGVRGESINAVPAILRKLEKRFGK